MQEIKILCIFVSPKHCNIHQRCVFIMVSPKCRIASFFFLNQTSHSTWFHLCRLLAMQTMFMIFTLYILYDMFCTANIFVYQIKERKKKRLEGEKQTPCAQHRKWNSQKWFERLWLWQQFKWSFNSYELAAGLMFIWPLWKPLPFLVTKCFNSFLMVFIGRA